MTRRAPSKKPIIHMTRGTGVLCKQPLEGLTLTRITVQVTCEKCKRVLFR